MPAKFEVQTSGLVVQSSGLTGLGQSDFRVKVASAELVPEAQAFVRWVADYIASSGKRIRHGETLKYGYWLTKFMASEDDVLEVWEYDANGTRFVRGATLSVTYWRDQHEICRNAGVEFSPPQADKLAVISAGVYEGEPIEGIRYPAPSHMTGWWFLTNQYKGDESTVNSVHLYHVTAARPDIARYVALPVGHVFRSSPPRVWFEENVANQPIPE